MILTTNTSKEDKMKCLKCTLEKQSMFNYWAKDMNFHAYEKARERFPNILIIAN